MAVGLPCLVLDAVGNRDAIEHDRTGLIARDIDELEMYLTVLLASAPLRKRLGTSAREQARERFSLERFHNSLMDLYGTSRAITGPAAAPATIG
jgi:glycosyltransferase involved in cell wall biosynthesis